MLQFLICTFANLNFPFANLNLQFATFYLPFATLNLHLQLFICHLQLNEETMKTLYYAMIYPQLISSISSWGGVPLSRQSRLITLQNRAIRIISKAEKKDHTTPLFQKLNLLKLTDIYKLRLLLIMHKIHNKLWFGNLNLKNIDSIHSYETRLSSNENYCLPQISSNIKKGSFIYIWDQNYGKT